MRLASCSTSALPGLDWEEPGSSRTIASIAVSICFLMGHIIYFLSSVIGIGGKILTPLNI